MTSRLSPVFANALLRQEASWEGSSPHLVVMGKGAVLEEVGELVSRSGEVFAAPLTGLSVANGWARADAVYVSGIPYGTELGTLYVAQIVDAFRIDPMVYLDGALAMPTTFTGGFWITWQAPGVFRL